MRAGFATAAAIAIAVAAAAGLGLATGMFLLAPLANNARDGPDVDRRVPPSIEMDGPNATFAAGDRLDFTVHTYGLCATPNVVISREENGTAVLLYQYMAAPVRCPLQEPGSNIHFEWKAEQLVQRVSGEFYGGDSELVRDAALGKAGNYTITASLLDWSDSVTRKFTVVDSTASAGAPGSAQARRMNLTSVAAYTMTRELVGEVVPGMEFIKGEPVLVQSTFSNPHAAPVSQYILVSSIRDQNPDPVPDQYASVTGDAAPQGKAIALELSWLPERAGNYTILVFSLTDADLKSTMPARPAAAIPVKVVEARQ